MPSLFEQYGDVYALFIDEPKRWAHEGPLLRDLVAEADAPARVLDLGCGPGFHARHLAAAGCRVVAIDQAPAMLRSARALAPADAPVDWRQGDLLDPVEGAFDLVLLLGNTLSAVERREGLFRHVAGLLAPGGRFLVQVLDYERLRRDRVRHVVRRGRVDGRDTVVAKVMTGVADGMVVAFTVQQEDAAGAWSCSTEQSRLRAPEEAHLLAEAEAAGLQRVATWSGMDRTPDRPGEGADRVHLFAHA